MKWTRIEKPLFFLKDGISLYTVLGAVLLVGLGLLCIVPSAVAAGGDWLSFVSNETGIFDIYVTDLTGENRSNVTNRPTNEWRINQWGPLGWSWAPTHTWSPDGRFVAYVSPPEGDLKIYIFDTRTQEHRRLTDRHEREWGPAWSPDGKWIAFVAGAANDIYKVSVNGTRLVRLTRSGGNRHPAWSPDGKWIAFVSSAHGEENKRKGLYVMNANGRELRLVPGTDKILLGEGCAWSPDGKRIAFSLYIPEVQRMHLCTIGVDGENFRQLTQGDPIVKPKEGPDLPLLNLWLPEISSPAWSSDGKRIAYVYSETIFWQTANIYMIDAAGAEPGIPVVTSTWQDLSPAWVPAGFLSVSPSSETQTTLWGSLKQVGK